MKCPLAYTLFNFMYRAVCRRYSVFCWYLCVTFPPGIRRMPASEMKRSGIERHCEPWCKSQSVRLGQKEGTFFTAPCIYFACAIENKVSCKSLEKLILFFSAKVFSHAGIVRFFLTAFSPYFSS